MTHDARRCTASQLGADLIDKWHVSSPAGQACNQTALRNLGGAPALNANTCDLPHPDLGLRQHGKQSMRQWHTVYVLFSAQDLLRVSILGRVGATSLFLLCTTPPCTNTTFVCKRNGHGQGIYSTIQSHPSMHEALAHSWPALLPGARGKSSPLMHGVGHIQPYNLQTTMQWLGTPYLQHYVEKVFCMNHKHERHGAQHVRACHTCKYRAMHKA